MRSQRSTVDARAIIKASWDVTMQGRNKIGWFICFRCVMDKMGHGVCWVISAEHPLNHMYGLPIMSLAFGCNLILVLTNLDM